MCRWQTRSPNNSPRQLLIALNALEYPTFRFLCLVVSKKLHQTCIQKANYHCHRYYHKLNSPRRFPDEPVKNYQIFPLNFSPVICGSVFSQVPVRNGSELPNHLLRAYLSSCPVENCRNSFTENFIRLVMLVVTMACCQDHLGN